jgi:hypothetical protein
MADAYRGRSASTIKISFYHHLIAIYVAVAPQSLVFWFLSRALDEEDVGVALFCVDRGFKRVERELSVEVEELLCVEDAEELTVWDWEGMMVEDW